jgi:hypothetical protein
MVYGMSVIDGLMQCFFFISNGSIEYIDESICGAGEKDLRLIRVKLELNVIISMK